MNPINILLFRVQSLTKIKRNLIHLICLIVIAGITITACTEDEPEQPDDTSGKIILNFIHHLNGAPVQFDTSMYVNAAGNPYLINEIQYNISDITLYNHNGSEILIDDWKDIYYVDTDIPASQSWEVFDKIPEGTYDSIAFTFGIPEAKNISFMFVNPPESFMFWPEYLGGGYHYLKLNGKWLEEGQQTMNTPFDFHLGPGQIYYSYPDSITGFVHNEFRISLSNSGFSMVKGRIMEFNIIMKIENWFKNPHIYDHDVWGGYIMQNQDAMQLVKENGWNVFSIELAKK